MFSALLICLVIYFFILFLMFNHQQLPQEKCDNICIKVGFFYCCFGHIFFDVDDRKNLSLILSPPPRCLFDPSRLRHCASPLVPAYYLFFPFLQLCSTLHQLVSHTNLLTSSRNTLFLFLRFLFSVPPSPPPQTHIFWTSSFRPVCCPPSYSLRTLVTRAK